MAVISKTDLENAGQDAHSLSDIVNGAADRSNPGHPAGTVTTRTGQVVKTVAKIALDLENSPIDANQAKIDAQAAQALAETAKTGADTAKAGAETAKTGAEAAQAAAETAQAGAQAAKTASESARDASLVAGRVYVDEPTGRAAVADGAYFYVPVSGSAIALILYRRVNAGTVSTRVADLPSTASIVEYEKRATFAPGKNIFDKAAGVQSYLLHTGNGSLVATSSAWWTSGYIPVTGNQQLTGIKLRYVCEYDNAKAFIAGTTWDAGSSEGATRTWNVHASAKYIRFTYQDAHKNLIQLELGAAATAYEAYAPKVQTPSGIDAVAGPNASILATQASYNLHVADHIKAVTGKNLLNKATSIYNRTIAPTGALSVTSYDWYASDYIEVSPSTQYTATMARYIAEYDASKVFIAGTYLDNAPSPGADHTWVTNASAKYIRVSYQAPQHDLMQVEAGAAKTSFEVYKLTMKTAAGVSINADPPADFTALVNNHLNPHLQIKPGGKNLFNVANVTKDRTMGPTGAEAVQLVYLDTWFISEYIEVTANTQVSIYKPRYVAEYDVNKVFIAGTYKDIPTRASQTFVTNAGTKYLRVVYNVADKPSGQVEYAAAPTGFQAFYYSLFYGTNKVLDLNFASSSGGSSVATQLVTHPDYALEVDRAKYQIYKASTAAVAIQAVHKNIAVQYKTPNILISTTGVNGDFTTSVAFNSTNFPNLITGSVPLHFLILPFTRNMTTSQTGRDYRIVVITDKGQIYHNFPARAVGSDGTANVDGLDFQRFDESAIWDLPERKYPSSNPAATGTERYYPGLPAECYDYHPALNVDNGYGHGGFDKSVTLNSVTYPRFSIPKRDATHCPFGFMGGYESGGKLGVIGTYKSNSATGEGTRICLLVSADGGRTWFNKYEMASAELSPWCNDINTSGIASAYTAASFVCKKRTLVTPTAGDKEPATKFAYDAAVVINDITRAALGVVETSTPHGLATGNTVIIQDNPGSGATSADWDWMRNETATTTDGGNGMLFKVEVVDATHFKLHDYVGSAYNSLPARHIHAVNRVKDGFIISCGEEHPCGWILFAYMEYADDYAVQWGHSSLPVVRLTSSATALQRLLGGILTDDPAPYFIGAQDSASIARTAIALPAGRTATLWRNSTGIFKCLLTDIDDISQSDCIYEAKQTAFFFKEKAGAWIFCGQEGEFAISFDKGVTWETEDLGQDFRNFGGEYKKLIVVNQFILALK